MNAFSICVFTIILASTVQAASHIPSTKFGIKAVANCSQMTKPLGLSDDIWLTVKAKLCASNGKVSLDKAPEVCDQLSGNERHHPVCQKWRREKASKATKRTTVISTLTTSTTTTSTAKSVSTSTAVSPKRVTMDHLQPLTTISPYTMIIIQRPNRYEIHFCRTLIFSNVCSMHIALYDLGLKWFQVNRIQAWFDLYKQDSMYDHRMDVQKLSQFEKMRGQKTVDCVHLIEDVQVKKCILGLLKQYKGLKLN